MAKDKEVTIRSSAAEYSAFIATTGDNSTSVELRHENENILLTQKMMAVLYGVDIRTVSDHIQKIFEDNKLDETSTIRNFRIVQNEGTREVSREVKHYNLQMTIAVGFKVNNEKAVQFRKWANQIVKDYAIQDWVMDVDRLEQGDSVLTQDYFDKQLEKSGEFVYLSNKGVTHDKILY